MKSGDFLLLSQTGWHLDEEENKKRKTCSDFWVPRVMLPVSALGQGRKRSSLTIWETHTFLIISSFSWVPRCPEPAPCFSCVKQNRERMALWCWGVKQCAEFLLSAWKCDVWAQYKLSFKAWRLQFHLNLSGEKSDAFSLSEMVKFCILQYRKNKGFDWTQQAKTSWYPFRNLFKNF